MTIGLQEPDPGDVFDRKKRKFPTIDKKHWVFVQSEEELEAIEKEYEPQLGSALKNRPGMFDWDRIITYGAEFTFEALKKALTIVVGDSVLVYVDYLIDQMVSEHSRVMGMMQKEGKGFKPSQQKFDPQHDNYDGHHTNQLFYS